MREILALGILIAGLWGTEDARAAVAQAGGLENCQELALQMNEYKTARHSLMKSLIKKNDTMADTLDIFADRFEDKKMSRVDKGDVASLKTSANSFRSHAQREGRLIDKFEQSSERLFTRVAECLKGNSPGAMASQ